MGVCMSPMRSGTMAISKVRYTNFTSFCCNGVESHPHTEGSIVQCCNGQESFTQSHCQRINVCTSLRLSLSPWALEQDQLSHISIHLNALWHLRQPAQGYCAGKPNCRGYYGNISLHLAIPYEQLWGLLQGHSKVLAGTHPLHSNQSILSTHP